MAKSKPTQMPPQAEKAMGGSESLEAQAAPKPLVEAELAILAGESAPTLEPPAAVTEAEAFGAWSGNKQINALWTINQNRNSWVSVVGVGWKKLSNVSDSGNVALTMLSAHARQLNRIVVYRDEADGMIHEMYVW